jgi:hypothetical protein
VKAATLCRSETYKTQEESRWNGSAQDRGMIVKGRT